MTTDTGLIYEFALSEGDQYAAKLASILSGADAALHDESVESDEDGDFVVEEPGD